ncbi:hypothetical protein GCM10010425_04290 [Streptomyces spororaveus]|uniref:Secreted protein n=1 Tax=Streptomyces spororaveus TaxID=284039 RepID=A0ABQ3TDE5_9ACTN|nr:hypothetical protein [Streptomyces spororaveus]MCM9081159.1 hypothetical protein [Streptomyces spororaveus]GHI78447.1 hypothetical protein Sspor_40080 [Streptomyces spororaveus]
MYTSRRRRPAAAPATVLLAAVLLAGCAGTGGSGGGEPELGPVEVNPATATLSLPMDAYTDTEAERIRMGQVQQALVSRCMARYGFTYEGVRPAEAAGAGAEDRHAYLFGLADPAYAAAHGYDKSAGEGSPAKPAPPPLSDSAYVVMTGEQPGARSGTAPDANSEEEAAQVDSGLTAAGQKVPAGGCGREGYRKLYAPTKDSVDLLFTFGLSSEAHDRSRQDSRVVDVLRKWSSCMDKSGYAGIESPYDVVEKLGLADDRGGPKAVTAAKADVACKREVNLVGIWGAVEKAYQERLVEEHAETLTLYRKQREARFKLAASLG